MTVYYGFGATSWSGTTYASSSARSIRATEHAVSKSRLAAALIGLGGPNCSFDSSTLVGSSATTSPSLPAQLTAAAASHTPGANGCEYFNPFLSSALNPTLQNSQELVDWLVLEETENRTWETRASGDLFNLPAGAVQMAIGYNYREQVFELYGNPLDQIYGDDFSGLGAGDGFLFTEEVKSQFVEVGIPILHNLDFSAAARREDYTDRPFGSVTKPKYSISYRPLDDLALRLSYSGSFTAPRGDELRTDNATIFNLSTATTDPFSNGGNGIPSANANGGQLVISGNPDLRPEETETINLGFTYRGIENWEFSMDLQEIKYFDRVISLSRAELFDRQMNDFLQSGLDINSNADVMAFFAANPNPNIERDPVNGGVTNIFQGPSNADDINARFVDIKVSHRLPTENWGLFFTQLSATGYERYLYLDDIPLEETDAVGKRNRDESAARALPRWKGNLILRWIKNDNSVVTRTSYVSGIKFDGEVAIGAEPPEEIKHFVTTDLRYSHQFREMLGGSMALTLGITNLFDREAQTLPVEQGLETRLQDPIGRSVYMEASYDF